MHLRNNTGQTPLFLSADAGLNGHISLFRQSGAHLHADELGIAKVRAQRSPEVWRMAGFTSPQVEDQKDFEVS